MFDLSSKKSEDLANMRKIKGHPFQHGFFQRLKMFIIGVDICIITWKLVEQDKEEGQRRIDLICNTKPLIERIVLKYQELKLNAQRIW